MLKISLDGFGYISKLLIAVSPVNLTDVGCVQKISGVHPLDLYGPPFGSHHVLDCPL